MGGRKPLSLEQMQAVAIARGGKCLSTHYEKSWIKLDWECKLWHKWAATSSHVLHGTWCPNCAENIKLSLEDAKTLAAQKNGRCLSDRYERVSAKLEWECEKNIHGFPH
jgi:hypothetical protein